MSALMQYRLRPCCVVAALLAADFALSGCAGMSETVAPAFADPAKYELYDCKQLEGERKSIANRTGDLQRLMEKAQTGAGGAVVSELAYRNDYIAVRGQAQMADDAWRRNKCRETPPEATPAAAAPAANPGPIKPGPKSTRAVR
ncbi:twin-arginine translocation pathway signal [Bradyrhizobium sp. 193]|uniref:twin-arginine translocation pathway signal n=1 Tax=unclassified Bradyrhizobium TaxID=2631580 RepID=UPI001FFBDCB2|nr:MULTISPECIES: twin-arginine translocation pathway signal [unclassified Bradyrhizobium]MCK1467014.1 twin-arginine translocation pathway signal [Bradyrhizobium sp. CW10]MCK1486129.1 twin-arginine translocation pathway signal [Bradyrhizobium sp. 193]MCK1583133.1 twin-arginine translocation pathway signal [Bradyrhizobium sp. 168]MCK1676504.1 twin-arginine translocation pathway signal [Bradyrhizobium sp. 150]UPK14199.1 twin-arginine translocation pathway signal [Bradyrhizobium sp. 155]